MGERDFFEQLRNCIDQMEKSTNAMNDKMIVNDKYSEKTATDSLISEYNDVLEQEFIKDKKGQEFAKLQFEEAQKYLILMFMNTPDGKKLAEERNKAFSVYKDDKLKSFLESKKKGDKINADICK